MNNWRRRSGYALFLLLLLVPLVASCANPFQAQGGKKVNSLSALDTMATATYGGQCSGGGNSQSVTVNVNQQTTTSQFGAGITLSDNQMLQGYNNNAGAVNNVQYMLQQGVKYTNTPIMGWGLPDPWPDPNSSGPTDWSSLDARLKMEINEGQTPVITLSEAPWWMKGENLGGGKTQTLTENEEWNNIAYSSRILDNMMGAWTTLVGDVAQRYMAPPYNVRYFQVWNELKGYWDFDTNNWDYNDSPGNPSGPNADNGYTYMYNQVYQTLMDVATSLHIPTQDIKVGGPYVVMDTYSNSQQGNASNVVEPFGVLDQRPLDVIKYWLQHKDGAGFITFDGALQNTNTNTILNNQPFVAAATFADEVKWVRSLDPNTYPGSTTLPIWLAEWYSYTGQNGTSPYEDNALKAYTMMQFVQAGGGTALFWNDFGDGKSDLGLWTSTANAGGGMPQPWYFTYKGLQDYFSSGTKLYATTVSNPSVVGAMASANKLMLVNETADNVKVHVNNKTISLCPYQVSFTDR